MIIPSTMRLIEHTLMHCSSPLQVKHVHKNQLDLIFIFGGKVYFQLVLFEIAGNIGREWRTATGTTGALNKCCNQGLVCILKQL